MFCHHSIKLYLAHFIAIILVGLTFPHSTNAANLPRSGTAPAYHSLEGQAGVLRMTLSGMNRFMVVKTGDPRHGTGELHKIKLHLVNLTPGAIEYFNYDWTSAFMSNRTRNKRGNTAYVPIHRRDIIEAHRRRPVPIWIYVRPGDRVRLEVTARELDCTKQRVCGRGDNSFYGFDMRVPYFTNRPTSSCMALNTWTLHQTPNGQWKFAGTPLTPIAQYPVTERGDLRIYPVSGTICFTGQLLDESLERVIRPLQRIIRLPGLFNKSKSAQ